MKYFFFLITLVSSTLIAQGPVDGYMKNKNDFSVGLSISKEQASKLFTGSNSINASRTTMAYSLFGIYGIHNRLNIQINLPYLKVNSEKDFQDFSFYLKFQAYKKENKKGNFNLLLASGVSHPIVNYKTNGGSALGQQATSFDGRIIVQQNFKNKFFTSLQAGYFLKSSPTPNAISSSIKIGYASKIYADVWFEIIEAIGGTDYRGTGELAPTAAKGGFKGLGFSYKKIGGTVYYPITNHIGTFGGLSYVLEGRNAFKNFGLNIGVVFQ